MRTSRVQGTTSSIYRQSKVAVSSDSAFRDTYEQGGGQQNRHALLNQQNKQKKQSRKKAQLSTIKSKMVMKGMQMSSESTHIHNYLIYRAQMASNRYLSRVCSHTYRTSI